MRVKLWVERRVPRPGNTQPRRNGGGFIGAQKIVSLVWESAESSGIYQFITERAARVYAKEKFGVERLEYYEWAV